MTPAGCPDRETLAALAVGRLSGEDLAAVAAHLDGCPACLALAQAATADTDPIVAALCRPDPANPYAREAGCDRADAQLREPAELGTASDLLTVMTPGLLPPPDAPAGPAAGVMRYRSVRLHARGGLGEVHVALDEELSRQVALKRIQRPRASDPESLRRFLQEAEITARLEHPGVVPVYGLVLDDSGQPCYAMRFIQGETLQEALGRIHAGDRAGRDPGERRLTMRDLLGRFVAVCNTVAYAHSRGVLHRDLKPANIMLGPYGETLVVDWGLAKPIGGGAAAPAAGAEAVAGSVGDHTRTGQALGTPAFMSPEQARGDLGALGPRSDVYSLGATLYCLLTGKPPFDRQAVDVLRKVERGEFPAPRRLDPSIDAALEAVCLKAMATEPADRYDSARALAEDVERGLADEPVAARREPPAERARRWARRHRTVVVGAAALVLTGVLALAVGLLAVGRQQRLTARERDEKELARRKIRATLDAVASEAIDTLLAQQPRLTDRHKAFLRLALDSYTEFARDPGADLATRAEVADAHYRMARIRDLLGQSDEAERALDVAIALYETLVRERPGDLAPALRLASCRLAAGVRLASGRHDDMARAQYMQAVDLLRRMQEAHPDRSDCRFQLAVALGDLSNMQADARDNDAALATLGDSLDLLAGLAAEFPGDGRYRAELASERYNLGILLEELYRTAEAETQYRQAVEIQERLVRERSDEPKLRLHLSSSLINLANVISGDLPRRQEAESLLDRGRALQEQLVREYAAVPLYRLRLGRTIGSLALLMQEQGRPHEAEAQHRRSIEIREGLVRDFPGQREYRRDLGSGRYQLALLYFRSGRVKEAEAEFRRALHVQDPLVQEMGGSPDFAIQMTRTLAMLGTCAKANNALGEAEGFLRRCLALQEDLARRFPSELQLRAELGDSYTGLGDVQTERGSPANALAWHDKAIGHLRAMLDERPDYAVPREILAAALFARGRAFAGLGRPDLAMDALRRAVAAGFRDFGRMQADRRFDPLRARDDFRMLALDVAFPAEPFARTP
jgi:serine/threonine-protein kinase